MVVRVHGVHVVPVRFRVSRPFNFAGLFRIYRFKIVFSLSFMRKISRREFAASASAALPALVFGGCGFGRSLEPESVDARLRAARDARVHTINQRIENAQSACLRLERMAQKLYDGILPAAPDNLKIQIIADADSLLRRANKLYHQKTVLQNLSLEIGLRSSSEFHTQDFAVNALADCQSEIIAAVDLLIILQKKYPMAVNLDI